MEKVFSIFIFSLFFGLQVNSQLKWKNVDSLYQPLPASVHVYITNDLLDGKPNNAYYEIADMEDKAIAFTDNSAS